MVAHTSLFCLCGHSGMSCGVVRFVISFRTKVTSGFVTSLLTFTAERRFPVEKFYVVMHWPKGNPAGPVTRYPYKFDSRIEAEQFRDAAAKAEPSYEYLIDELQEVSKN